MLTPSLVLAAAMLQVPAIPPVVQVAPRMQYELQLALPKLEMIQPQLELATMQFRLAMPAISVQLPRLTMELAQVAPRLELALAPLALALDLDQDAGPREPWAQQDPGDSLYRAARRALNRNRYAEAAQLFQRLHDRYPRSTYAADAFYWAAFALYKTGDTNDLKRARDLLVIQVARRPQPATHRDAQSLMARIDGDLARRGDADAARRVTESAGQLETPQTQRPQGAQCAQDDDDDPRMAALNALLQMDSDRALPILRQVIKRRDACSVELRRKAMFIIAQKNSTETVDILLDAARNDPDSEVRQNAVFWLSQVRDPRAVDMLDSIIRTSRDNELLEKAVFALSQQNSPRAGEILRSLVERPGVSTEVRGNALFWIGQSSSAESQAFLRDLFGRLDDPELRDKIIFGLSQQRSTENTRFLMDIALNERVPMETRKQALFWAGQGGASMTDLTALYGRTENREMREQLIFIYSQRREREAVDKLMDIAKNDPDRELRKNAIFWLGQSRDPRVAEFLLNLINQP
jgi:HEAT repeat protein